MRCVKLNSVIYDPMQMGFRTVSAVANEERRKKHQNYMPMMNAQMCKECVGN